MSYVDRYAIALRQAADGRARRAGQRPRRRPRAGRAVAVTLAIALAAVATAVVLPGLRTADRAVGPLPPSDPIVMAYLGAVRNSDARREPACRPPRPGLAQLADEPVAAAALDAFGVLRRRGGASRRLLRRVRQWGDPRGVVLTRSVRLLGRPPRAVLFAMRGPVGRIVPRDPRACNALLRAELDRRTARSSEEVRAAARQALDDMLERELNQLAGAEQRLFLFSLDRHGRVAGGGGGATAEQVRRTGMGGSSTVRHRGRRARAVQGLVPDDVHEIEVVARGAGERAWVRRHRVAVRDNFFLLEGFHAHAFRIRWLDARGREIERRSAAP